MHYACIYFLHGSWSFIDVDFSKQSLSKACGVVFLRIRYGLVRKPWYFGLRSATGLSKERMTFLCHMSCDYGC